MKPAQSPLSSESARALLGAGGLYTVGRLLQLLGGLLVVPILTRSLTPADFGTVAAALVVVQLLALVAAVGLPAALTRIIFDPDGGEHARGIVLAVFMFALPAAGVAHLTGPFWTGVFRELEYGRAAQTAVLTAVPLAVLTATLSVFQAQRQAVRFVVIALLGTVGAQVVGIALLLTDPDRSAVRYLLGYLIGSSLAAVLAVGFTGLSARVLIDRRPLRAALAVGLPTVPHVLGLSLLSAGDRVLIERLHGLGAVGRYQVAYALGTLGLVALTALNNAWAPLVYGASPERRWQELAATSTALSHLATLSAAGLAFAAPLVVRVAAPPDYGHRTMGITAAIVALAVVPYVVYLSRVHVLFQTTRTRALAVITPLTAVGNIVLNLLVLPVAGLPGAAGVTVATYAAQATLVHRRASRLAAVQWNLREDARTWVVAACLVALGAALPATGAWVAVRFLAALGFVAMALMRIRRLVDPTGSRQKGA
ncbi:MAG: lipopolysaccharide biosynthesis protein [Acidimicrobiales bacterium]